MNNKTYDTITLGGGECAPVIAVKTILKLGTIYRKNTNGRPQLSDSIAYGIAYWPDNDEWIAIYNPGEWLDLDSNSFYKNVVWLGSTDESNHTIESRYEYGSRIIIEWAEKIKDISPECEGLLCVYDWMMSELDAYRLSLLKSEKNNEHSS